MFERTLPATIERYAAVHELIREDCQRRLESFDPLAAERIGTRMRNLEIDSRMRYYLEEANISQVADLDSVSASDILELDSIGKMELTTLCEGLERLYGIKPPRIMKREHPRPPVPRWTLEAAFSGGKYEIRTTTRTRGGKYEIRRTRSQHSALHNIDKVSSPHALDLVETKRFSNFLCAANVDLLAGVLVVKCTSIQTQKRNSWSRILQEIMYLLDINNVSPIEVFREFKTVRRRIEACMVTVKWVKLKFDKNELLRHFENSSATGFRASERHAEQQSKLRATTLDVDAFVAASPSEREEYLLKLASKLNEDELRKLADANGKTKGNMHQRHATGISSLNVTAFSAAGDDARQEYLIELVQNLSSDEFEKLEKSIKQVLEQRYKELIFGDKKPTVKRFDDWLAKMSRRNWKEGDSEPPEITVGQQALYANAVKHFRDALAVTLYCVDPESKDGGLVECTLTTGSAHTGERFRVRPQGDSSRYLWTKSAFPPLSATRPK